MKNICRKPWFPVACILALLLTLVPLAQASEPLSAGITVDRESAYTNEHITWTYTISGGTGRIYYQLDTYKDGEAYSHYESYTDFQNFTLANGCSMQMPGEYYVILSVRDDTAALEERSPVTIVYALPPLYVALMMDRTAAVVGEPIVWKMDVTGGLGTPVFDFHIYCDDIEIGAGGWTADPVYTHTTARAGDYYTIVHFRNDTEEFDMRSDFVHVSEQLRFELNVDRTEASVGEAVTWTVNGGTAIPAVDFHIMNENGEIIYSDAGAPASFTYAFTAPGTYYAAVKYGVDGETYEASSDYTIVSEGPGDGQFPEFPFRLTQAACNERGLMETIMAEFGQTAVLADWKELRELYGEMLPAVMESLGLADTECAWLVYNTRNWSDARETRHYFLERFDGGAPISFLKHDQLGTIYLGSWYGINARVLVRIVE